MTPGGAKSNEKSIRHKCQHYIFKCMNTLSGSVQRARVSEVLAVIIALCVLLVPVAVITRIPPPGWANNHPPYKQLTFGSWNDVSPAWSPDGKVIAYVSDQNDVWEVFTMDPDGTSKRAITPASYNASSPSWNPDSTALAFLSQAGSRTDVRVAFLANSTILTLTDGSYSVLQAQPKWSPDGTQLLFFTGLTSTRLMSADLKSRVLKTVAEVNGSNFSAAWVSPTQVVFSTLGQGRYQIDWANVETGDAGVIVKGAANFYAPVASINTSRLAYISDIIPPIVGRQPYPSAYRPGDCNLWVSDLNGRNATFQFGPTGATIPGVEPYPYPYTPATIDPAQSLAWSYDGKLIAYTAYSELYGVNIYLWDVATWSSSIGLLGPTNSNCTGLSWSPDNVSLAFAAVSSGFFRIFVLNTTGQVGQMPVAIVD